MSDGLLFATVNHQGGPRGGDEFVSTNWWMGMASRTAGKGQLTLTGMLSLDPATATARGYREIFQSGEVLQRTADHRSAASARSGDAGRVQLARADRLPDRVHDRGRTDRRAGARADGVHAPAVGRRQSGGAARPSHARLDPHRDGRRHRRARSRAVHDRSVALQRAGARRQPLGRDGSGRARLVVGARVVRAVTRLAVPGLVRLSERTGSRRAGRHQTDDRLRGVAQAAAGRIHGGDSRRRPQRHRPRRLSYAAGRGDRPARSDVVLRTARNHAEGDAAERRDGAHPRRGARRDEVGEATRSASAATSPATRCPTPLDPRTAITRSRSTCSCACARRRDTWAGCGTCG